MSHPNAAKRLRSLFTKQPLILYNNRLLFGQYCDEWLHASKNTVKESTYVKYHNILTNHIKPRLGDCHPLLLTTEQIAVFRDALLYEEGLSPKTVRDVLITLKSILNYTAKQFPGNFPPIDIVYPKNAKKEMRVLSLSEQNRLVTFLLTEIDPCKFGILLSLFTGLRIGELCALRWENISLQDRTIKSPTRCSGCSNWTVLRRKPIL